MRTSKIFLAGVVIALDLITKFFARQYFPNHVVQSPGFPLPAVIAGLFVFILLAKYQGLAGNWGLALILGGAFANLIDRIFDGEVTDFFNLGIATFNLADIAIWLGVVLSFRRFVMVRSS